MKEKNIQTLFGKYLKTLPFLNTAAYELKFTTKDSIMINSSNPKNNAVKDEQIEALLEVAEGRFYYKIPDAPFGHTQGFQFHLKRPFDCFTMDAMAYVGICYYKPRQPKELILINIHNFLNEKKKGEGKSLKESRAREIADKIIVLPNK